MYLPPDPVDFDNLSGGLIFFNRPKNFPSIEPFCEKLDISSQLKYFESWFDPHSALTALVLLDSFVSLKVV